MSTPVTVSVEVKAPVTEVWKKFTQPHDIMQWNQASDDWHCPRAENDLQHGGTFSYTMASRDGEHSFDFGGVYDEVVPHAKIAYTLGDGRKVKVEFTESNGVTRIDETFDPENMNSREMQQAGWQAILDNFKKYAEK